MSKFYPQLQCTVSKSWHLRLKFADKSLMFYVLKQQLLQQRETEASFYGRPKFCLCGFFFLVLFILAYSQRSQIRTWCGLSAYLECRPETCCTRLVENTGRKNSPSVLHCTTLSGYTSATKPCIDNRKKLVKQQDLLHISWQCGELRPTSGWDRLAGLGHPSKFQQVSRIGFVTAPTSPGLSTLRIWGILPPWQNFHGCKIHFLFQVLCSPIWAALLHGTCSVGISQTLQRLAEGTTYIWQGSHHITLGVGSHCGFMILAFLL